jgi:hypothetical protein
MYSHVQYKRKVKLKEYFHIYTLAMAKTTSSLVLVVLVMAIFNGHLEAAGKGAEPGKDYKSQKTGLIFYCPFWYGQCFVAHVPLFCSLYYQYCVPVDHAPNAPTVAKSPTP